jgi:D-lactate dehydrogenase (cytochrome)
MGKELIKILDGRNEEYLSDESKMKGFASSISFPKTKEEAAEIVRRMSAAGVSITAQGGKTGICGAAVPLGGHIMNLSRMAKALALRKTEDGYTLKVQSGLTLSELRKMLSSKSFNTEGWDQESLRALDAFRKDAAYFWPPDPTETSAAIGGMIGTNAQSITDYRYGRIKNYIEEVELVDSKGEICTTRRLDLYLGSEGMYGIFTGASLRLIKKPRKMWGICCFFEEEARLLRFAERALLIPKEGASSVAAVEYIGRLALGYIRKLSQTSSKLQDLPDIDEKYNGIAYVELHGDSQEELMALTEKLAADLSTEERSASWVLFGESGIEKVKLLRHSVPESVNMTIQRRAMNDPRIIKLSTDLTTRNSLTEDVLRYQSDADFERLEAVIFGHVPENRLHVNIIPNSYEEYERGKRLVEAWYLRALESGGTVFREHGIGKVKKTLFRDVMGEDALVRIMENKKALDPQNLLNPGNML